MGVILHAQRFTNCIFIIIFHHTHFVIWCVCVVCVSACARTRVVLIVYLCFYYHFRTPRKSCRCAKSGRCAARWTCINGRGWRGSAGAHRAWRSARKCCRPLTGTPSPTRRGSLRYIYIYIYRLWEPKDAKVFCAQRRRWRRRLRMTYTYITHHICPNRNTRCTMRVRTRRYVLEPSGISHKTRHWTTFREYFDRSFRNRPVRIPNNSGGFPRSHAHDTAVLYRCVFVPTYRLRPDSNLS